jgi:hypothetical protein
MGKVLHRSAPGTAAVAATHQPSFSFFLPNRVSLSLIERLPCLCMHPKNNPRASLLHFQGPQAAPLSSNDPIANRFMMPSTFLSENQCAPRKAFISSQTPIEC